MNTAALLAACIECFKSNFVCVLFHSFFLVILFPWNGEQSIKFRQQEKLGIEVCVSVQYPEALHSALRSFP